MAGNARLMTARAFVDEKKILREGKNLTEVTKQFRAMRASERWNPPPPEDTLTPEKVVDIRYAMLMKNPEQQGFSVNVRETITMLFYDLCNIRNAKELAAMMISDSFNFPVKKEPEDYIIYISEEGNTTSKAIFTVVQDQRAVDQITGENQFRLDNYPVSCRIYI
eukprot:1732328-Rhodomonas_salina.1